MLMWIVFHCQACLKTNLKMKDERLRVEEERIEVEERRAAQRRLRLQESAYELIKGLLKAGIIVPETEVTEWVSPSMFVPSIGWVSLGVAIGRRHQ